MKRVLKFFGWTLAGLFGLIVVLLTVVVIHANYRIGKDETLAIDAQAPGSYVMSDGHKLHYTTIGDIAADPSGAPLLLMHGFLVSGHTMYLPWAEEKLAPHRALILPDMYGYGFSERNTAPGNHYTPRAHAQDFVNLLDQLGVQQVDVVGFSWGGVMAAQFALDHPTRVRRVVLMDAGFFVKPGAQEGIINLPLGIGRAVAWHALSTGPSSYPRLLCGARPDCPLLKPAYIRDSVDSARAQMYTSRHSTGLTSLEAEVGRITTPTLVLWGANDRIIPGSSAERLAREIKGARLVVVPDAWHMPFLEKPDDVARHILEFLDGKDGRLSFDAVFDARPRLLGASLNPHVHILRELVAQRDHFTGLEQSDAITQVQAW